MSDATMNMIIDYAVKVGGVLLLILVARWVGAWAGRVVKRRLEARDFDATLTRFFATVTRQLIVLMAVLACLGVFGVETTSFVAIIGAAGLAIGLAFQGALSNFAAGVMLLVFRPFKVGDVVSAAGVTAKIVEIELFTTRMDTPDNRRMIVPNKAVFGATIENITFHATRRVDVSVGVDYSADIATTRTVLEGVANGVPNTLQEPGPAVILKGLGDSSVDWVVRVWCNTPDYFAVLEATTQAVKLALDEASIGIPYPTVDVNMANAA